MHFKSSLRTQRFYIVGILLTVCMNNVLQAQSEKSFPLQGKTELSTAFTFQSVKEKDASEGSWVLILPIQMRYFATQNIGVGAEVIFADFKGEGNTGYVLNGLVEVAFPSPQRLIPFLIAGYGLSNGSYVLDRLAVKNYDDTTLGVLNLGGGIRVPLGEKVFGKIELRYQKFTGEYKYDTFFGTQTIDIGTTYVNVLFGLSLLL